MASEIEAAQNFPRNILRGILGPMFGGVERDDANRVAVLAGHQVGDGGFEIGFADIGFRKRGARFSIIVDDEIKILVVPVRYNRRGPIPAHMCKLPMQRDTGKSKHESKPLKPQLITADHPR